ncbi:hypothetical protein ABFT80_06070 [Mesorhizobium sp. SB112]|uniref:hypothetical protein n=1 Tax=Mesorhizobium sp. SB112 TaxID=3151853 RepID=UPI00326404A6
MTSAKEKAREAATSPSLCSPNPEKDQKMNSHVDSTASAGAASFTRRLFLRGTIAASVGASVAVPAVAQACAKERAVHHWGEFFQAIREMAPADCRIQVYGGAHGFRAEALRRIQEEVRPGLFIPIERIAYESHFFGEKGWIAEGLV